MIRCKNNPPQLQRVIRKMSDLGRKKERKKKERKKERKKDGKSLNTTVIAADL